MELPHWWNFYKRIMPKNGSQFIYNETMLFRVYK